MVKHTLLLRRTLLCLLLLSLVWSVPAMAGVKPDGPVIGVDHPTTPGSVMLFKEAKPVPGLVNTWEVTLRVEVLDRPDPTDIVLVIDRSGSMESEERLVKAKAAAVQFVNTLLNDYHPQTRISLVSYSSYATRHTVSGSVFVNYTQKQGLIDQINGLTAGGGTHTQDGLYAARSRLQSQSTATHKHIVLLSDGVPTYSFAINSPWRDNTNNLTPYPADGSLGWETPTTVPTGEFNRTASGRVGNGWNTRTRYHNPDGDVNDRYYNHGNSAIAEAGFAKDMLAASGTNDFLYTIALGAGAEGEQVLGQIASPGKDYVTNSPENLDAIFNEIASAIGSSVNNARITDPIALGFQVDAGTMPQVELTPTGQAGTVANPTGNTFVWNLPAITGQVPGQPNPLLKYAQLRYAVEINQDILDVPPPDRTYYPTNGDAGIEYTDIDGNTTTQLFPKPQVNPVLVKLQKTLLDAFGNPVPATDGRYFKINVRHEANTTGGRNHWLAGGDSVVLTGIRAPGEYTVTEVFDTDTDHFNHTAADYDITIEVRNPDTGAYQEVSTFNVLTNSDPDTEVRITNQEKRLGRLGVYKLFDPLGDGNTDASNAGTDSPEFEFRVTDPNGNEIYPSGTPSVRLKLKPGQYYFFENLPYGTYTVEETVTNGFDPSYKRVMGNGPAQQNQATLSYNSKQAVIEVTNTPEEDDRTFNIYARKLWAGVDEPEDGFYAVNMTLLQDGVLLSLTPVITPHPTNPRQFDYVFGDVPKYRPDGTEYNYTVEEESGPYIITNHRVFTETVDGVERTITEYTNTYTEGITNFTARKIWAGGDPSSRPDIYFTLYRRLGDDAMFVPVTRDELLLGDPAVQQEPTQLVPNSLTVTWTDLPTTATVGGEVLRYTYAVKETDADGNGFTPPGYEKVGGIDDKDEFEGPANLITNTYIPPTANVTAEKIWVGGENYNGGVRPAVWFELWRHTQGTVPTRVADAPRQQPTLNPDGTWTTTWADMPSKNNNGVDYIYRVREVSSADLTDTDYDWAPDGYVKSGGELDPDFPLTITNTFRSPKIEVTAEKTWMNAPALKPTIGFQLRRTVAGATGTPDIVSGTDWVLLPSGVTSATWYNLDQYDPDGNEYIYSVTEFVPDEGYDPDLNPSITEGPPEGYIGAGGTGTEYPLWIDNVRIPLDKVARKTWSGGEALGPRPAVTLQLYRESPNEPPQPILDEVTLDGEVDENLNPGDSGEWTPWEYTFTKLLDYDDEGLPWHYYVLETSIGGVPPAESDYTQDITPDMDITNTYRPPNTTMAGTKRWIGGDPAEHKAVRLTLYRVLEGADMSQPPQRVGENLLHTVDPEEDGRDSYDYLFTHLPGTDARGVPYIYYFLEEGYHAEPGEPSAPLPPHYVASYSDTTLIGGAYYANAGATVFNTRAMDIPVTKVWVGPPADSATIQLLADGVPLEEHTLTLNAANNWRGAFTGLPQFDTEDEHEIVYTIREQPLNNYTTVISGSAAEGFTVTNTHVPPTYPTIRVPLSAKKVLNNGSLQAGAFTFELRGESGAAIAQVTNKADGTVTFPDLTFNQEVTDALYTIREVAGTDTRMRYDDTVYTIKVSTKAVSGQLQATINVEKDGKLFAGAMVFTNTYTPPVDPPAPTPTYPTLRVPLSVQKVLKNGTLKAGAFTFELRDGRGKFIAQATNAADGTVTFPDRTFSKVVTNYLYTIREIEGADSKMIYDNTLYTVKVSTKAVNGQLQATIHVEKNGTPFAGPMVFTNQRKLPPTGDSMYTIMALLMAGSLLMAGGAYALSRRRRRETN